MTGPRQRHRPPDQQHRAPEIETQRRTSAPPPSDEGGGEVPAPPPEARGVLFSHGIHQVELPAAGLTIAQVRETLLPLINIDPEAIAVVRGQRIENPDEFTIGDEVELVSFVKPASVKGSGQAPERIELSKGTSTVHLARSTREVPTESVIGAIQRQAMVGLHVEANPSIVRWRVDCDGASVFILELEPEIRSLPWLADDSPAPFGPRAKYEPRALALPFVVVKVVFRHGKLYPHAELFFRNEPLRSLDDELSWSNLLNVSPNSYDCTAWVCTQYVGRELMVMAAQLGRKPSVIEQLDALHRHLWWGGFNRSSEQHEGQSCFSKAKEDGLDERVTDVDKWARATDDDWRFILDIEWRPTGVDVRQLIVDQFVRFDLPVDLSDPSELTSLLLAERPEPAKKGA